MVSLFISTAAGLFVSSTASGDSGMERRGEERRGEEGEKRRGEERRGEIRVNSFTWFHGSMPTGAPLKASAHAP